MALFKILDPSSDIANVKTVVTTEISSALAGTIGYKSLLGKDGILYPPGYARGVGECSSSFFTLTTSSQIVDISYGIRSGCFDDTGSVFYQTDTAWGGAAGGFTSTGLNAFKTSSMIYKSTADYLNDGKNFFLPGQDQPIDLLGVLNFKRSSYKEELEAGTFTLTAHASGTTNSTPSGLEHYTYTDSDSVSETIVGKFTQIKAGDGEPVGGVYLDYGIAILDLFRLFFTSSTDRDATNSSRLMNFLTGSPKDTVYSSDGDDGTVACRHAIAFLSGSPANKPGEKSTKYYGTAGFSHRTTQLQNFYSGSYSQSLASLCMDLCGVSVNSLVNFQSSIFFCNSTKDQFNYSANPTFTTGSGDNLTYRTKEPLTYITSVGLFNDRDECLAIGKLSQPYKKDFSTDMGLRVRLDF